MKNLSLKLHHSIFSETERIIKRLRVSRNSYINEAVKYYNYHKNKQLLKSRLAKESKLVAKSSIEILKDFEKLDA